MANTPWARLTKPIRPMVTDRPTEMTYRIAPKARPWNRMLTRLEKKASTKIRYDRKTKPPSVERRGFRRFNEMALLFLVEFLPRILDRRDRFQLDVGKHAVYLAHFAHVFVLHDVARR